jgi:hypothetical protein
VAGFRLRHVVCKCDKQQTAEVDCALSVDSKPVVALFIEWSLLVEVVDNDEGEDGSSGNLNYRNIEVKPHHSDRDQQSAIHEPHHILLCTLFLKGILIDVEGSN